MGGLNCPPYFFEKISTFLQKTLYKCVCMYYNIRVVINNKPGNLSEEVIIKIVESIGQVMDSNKIPSKKEKRKRYERSKINQ